MVMDLLGPSLQHLFEKRNGRFSLPTTLRLAIQLLSIIHTLHERSIIHRFLNTIHVDIAKMSTLYSRDISPGNFAVGLSQRQIFCLDLGMASRYRDPKTLKHHPFHTCRYFKLYNFR